MHIFQFEMRLDDEHCDSIILIEFDNVWANAYDGCARRHFSTHGIVNRVYWVLSNGYLIINANYKENSTSPHASQLALWMFSTNINMPHSVFIWYIWLSFATHTKCVLCRNRMHFGELSHFQYTKRVHVIRRKCKIKAVKKNEKSNDVMCCGSSTLAWFAMESYAVI